MTGLPLPKRNAAAFRLAAGGVLVTAPAGGRLCLPLGALQPLELLVMTAAAWHGLRDKLNLCLYPGFSSMKSGPGCGISWPQVGSGYHGSVRKSFIKPNAPEYLAGIWLVRLWNVHWMQSLFLAAPKEHSHTHPGHFGLPSVLVFAGTFSGLSPCRSRRSCRLSEEQAGTWIILSMVLLFAVLFYRVSRQREMELEIAQLETGAGRNGGTGLSSAAPHL